MSDPKKNHGDDTGFEEYLRQRYACPVCQEGQIGSPGEYLICDICGWEDDPIQRDLQDYDDGANQMSLNEARKRWVADLAIDPNFPRSHGKK